MKKVLFLAVLFISISAALFSENFYEIPYVGKKSKITLLEGSQREDFIKNIEILPMSISEIYREEIPDENGKYVLTLYRVMYFLLSDENKQLSINRNFISSNKTIHKCFGQEIYAPDDKGILRKLYNSVYFGNTNAYLECNNLQFKIDSGYIYTFSFSILKNYADPETPDVKMVYSEISQFDSKCYIYKNKIEYIHNQTKIAYIPHLYCAPLLDELNPFKYSIQNAFDNDPSTSYVPNSDDNLLNMEIYFDIQKDGRDIISEIVVINGYAATQNLYKQNNRLKEIHIYPSSTSITFKEIINKQYIKISNKDSFYLSFITNSFYPGTMYNDTCLSEFNMKGEKNGWFFGSEK